MRPSAPLQLARQYTLSNSFRTPPQSQLEKVEAAIALVQDLELSSGAADSPRAGDSGSLEAKRSSRPSLAGRASENGGAQSNNDAAADGPESLSSILAADAAIALSLLASRVPPPPTPEPFLSGPGSTGSVVGAAHLSSTGGFAPAAGPVPTTTVAMPPLRDAAPDVAPGPPADDNGAPELSAGTAAQRRDAEASQPADQGDGRGAAFRFIHPDSPSAAAAAAVLRGAGSFEPAASTSSSHAQGSPRAGPAVPGPPQAADSASSNILFAVMNALCAPPPNPDDSHAETRDSSIPCSSGSEARLVSGGDDGTVRVWRVGGGEPGMVMRGHKARPGPLFIVLKRKRIPTYVCRLTFWWGWKMEIGLPTSRPEPSLVSLLQGPVCSLVVLPNGRLASGSADKTIIIWRLSTGKLERTLKGHTHTARREGEHRTLDLPQIYAPGSLRSSLLRSTQRSPLAELHALAAQHLPLARLHIRSAPWPASTTTASSPAARTAWSGSGTATPGRASSRLPDTRTRSPVWRR